LLLANHSAMTHLYLIRHVQSVLAHDLHIRDVRVEDRLTAKGVKQAERLRDRLAATGEIKADALLASTPPRWRLHKYNDALHQRYKIT
jgi:probable phosphoglycerate mutase